jgi:hypothetical protein
MMFIYEFLAGVAVGIVTYFLVYPKELKLTKFLWVDESYLDGRKLVFSNTYPGGKNIVMQLLYELTFELHANANGVYDFILSLSFIDKMYSTYDHYSNDYPIHHRDDKGRTVFYYIDRSYFLTDEQKEELKTRIINAYRKALGSNLRYYSIRLNQNKKLQKTLKYTQKKLNESEGYVDHLEHAMIRDCEVNCLRIK